MAKTMIYKSDQGKETVQGFYTDLLSQNFQHSSHRLLSTSFGNTFLIEKGKQDAPAVILLHGSSSNLAMWAPEVEDFKKSYRVIAVDILGEVGRSSENRPPFSDDSYARWVDEIMNQLKIEKASFVTCSLGGWIAMDYALRYPEKVEKLILTATAGIVQVKPKTIFWIIMTSMMGKWGFNKLNQMVYGNLEIDPQALAFADLIKEHYKPRTDVLPLFSNDKLKNIKAPTLFIGGQNDCFYNSGKSAARLQANLSDVQCCVLPNTGHILTKQSKRILDFLNNSNYAV